MSDPEMVAGELLTYEPQRFGLCAECGLIRPVHPDPAMASHPRIEDPPGTAWPWMVCPRGHLITDHRSYEETVVDLLTAILDRLHEAP